MERANGQSLVESSVISGIPKSSRVHIIKSTYVSSRRATFVETEMHSPLFESDAVMFELDELELRAAGLNATNCLLTKMPNGRSPMDPDRELFVCVISIDARSVHWHLSTVKARVQYNGAG